MKKHVILITTLNLLCWFTVRSQIAETVIGSTTYDLQTNASNQERIINHGNGTISAAWTFSQSFDFAAADRGTGYNFFDGVSWGTAPSARIEAEKTGWPNIATTISGEEVFICHNIAQSSLTMGKRPAAGSGAWTLSNNMTTYDQVWNRMTIGGSNGQTIHHISLYDPFGGPWPANGVQSQMLYYRSPDGGTTWDITDSIIPGLDETNYVAFSGDAFHMANAKGDTLAFVYFGDLNNVVLAK